MSTQHLFRILAQPRTSPSVAQSLYHTPNHIKRGTQAQSLYIRLLSTKIKSSKPISRTANGKEAEKKEPWMAQKAALESKFGDAGWQPRKRLSPDAMEGIRALHKQDADFYSVPYLANQFEISPEAIRRILKSKWRPTADEEAKRHERWQRRGQSVWNRWAELGYKPPKKWRAGVEGKTASLEAIEGQSKSKEKRSPSNILLSNRIL